MDKTEEKRARRAVGANGSTTGGPGGGGKKSVATAFARYDLPVPGGP